MSHSANIGILQFHEHTGTRTAFLVVAQLLFFVLGSGFYTFPMWLNFILPHNIGLSRELLTLLGALPFVGILGTSGILVLWINSLKWDKTIEFYSLTIIAAVCGVTSWIALFGLSVGIKSKIEFHDEPTVFVVCVVVLALILLFMGNSVGVYFTSWLGKLFPLIKGKWIFVYSALSNMSFASGSIVSLILKLYMSVTTWMTLMLVVQVIAIVGSSVFVFLSSNKILLHHNQEPTSSVQTTEVSTKQLLIELALWRRQYDRHTLSKKDCNVRSSQFYLIVLCFALSCALATTFMANLGPLLSAQGQSDDFDSQLIVLIWASVGQTVARMIIPFLAHALGEYMSPSLIMLNNVQGASLEQLHAISRVRIGNRSTLGFTFVISCVFFVFLIVLRFTHDISFIFASSVISGAYGSMWVVNNSFPLFLPSYNFGVILSVLQFFGMFAMLAFVAIISGLSLDNDSVFVLLLVVAVITMIVTVATIVDRGFTEPSYSDILGENDNTDREKLLS